MPLILSPPKASDMAGALQGCCEVCRNLLTHSYEIDSGEGVEESYTGMIPARRPTQKQMANALGVSQALVSRALSGRALQIGASPQTVERI